MCGQQSPYAREPHVEFGFENAFLPSLKLSNVGPGQYLDGRPCQFFYQPGQTGWQPDHIFAAAVHNSTQLCGQIVPSLDGFHLIWQPVK